MPVETHQSRQHTEMTSIRLLATGPKRASCWLLSNPTEETPREPGDAIAVPSTISKPWGLQGSRDLGRNLTWLNLVQKRDIPFMRARCLASIVGFIGNVSYDVQVLDMGDLLVESSELVEMGSE